MAVAASIDTLLVAKTTQFDAATKKSAQSIRGVGDAAAGARAGLRQYDDALRSSAARVKTVGDAAKAAKGGVDSFLGGLSPKRIIASLLTLEAMRRSIHAIQDGLKRGIFDAETAAGLERIGREAMGVRDEFIKFQGTIATGLAPVLNDILRTASSLFDTLNDGAGLAARAARALTEEWENVQLGIGGTIHLMAAAKKAMIGNITESQKMLKQLTSGEFAENFLNTLHNMRKATSGIADEAQRTANAFKQVNQFAANYKRLREEAQKKNELLEREAERVREAVRTPQETFADEMAKLEELFNKQKLDLETFTRAAEAAFKRLQESEKIDFGPVAELFETLKSFGAALLQPQQAPGSPSAIEVGTSEFVSALLQSQKQSEETRLAQQQVQILGRVEKALAPLKDAVKLALAPLGIA